MEKQFTIALVAGEASGDQLGEALIQGIKLDYPEARFVGIGGNGMRSAGMETWWDSKELAVFGLFEVLGHFPRLLRLRRQLLQKLLETQADVFIGIDAPDFNLGLEIKLKSADIRTIQYVSPTVWAWRSKRVHKIARAADLVMCLFPFEPAFYKGHGVDAVYVGHPMAKEIALDISQTQARNTLSLMENQQHVALLPGSRSGEVSRLAPHMIEAAKRLLETHPELRFIAAMANQQSTEIFQEAMSKTNCPDISLIEGQTRTVIAAADVVICASGTATLETMLINRPMVVAYRLASPTYLLAKTIKLVNSKFISLPNILAGETLVPELIQDEANGKKLADAARNWLDDENHREKLKTRFDELHRLMLADKSPTAHQVVVEFLGKPI
jgi:lipid-A-disaccharide synthase